MDRERYIALTLENLRRHIETHPLAGPEDKVKFIFQALLGVGHLLGDKRGMIRYIENELSEQSVTVDEPLCELVGPGWMRLNLRTAAEEGLKPETIANMAIILIKQCDYLLYRQLESLGKAFAENGGFSERMTRIRLQNRDKKMGAMKAPR